MTTFFAPFELVFATVTLLFSALFSAHAISASQAATKRGVEKMEIAKAAVPWIAQTQNEEEPFVNMRSKRS